MASNYTTKTLPYLDTRPKSGASIPSGEKANAVYIANYLKSQGYTKAGAQAVLANVNRESSFNPAILERGVGGSSDIGGTGGYGLIQWTGQKTADGKLRRRGKLEKAANFNVATRDSLDFQTKYLVSEVAGKAIATTLKTEQDPVAATLDLLFLDIRPGSAIRVKDSIKNGQTPSADDIKRVQRRVDAIWEVQSIVDEVYGDSPLGDNTGSAPTATGTGGSTATTPNSANADTVNAQSNAIQSSTEIPALNQEPIYTKDSFVRNTAQHFKKMLSGFVAFRLKNVEEKDTGVLDNDDLNEFWIPLFVILDIYNQYVSLLDGTTEPQKGSNTPGRKLTQFYTGYQDKDISKKEYEKKCKFLTNEMHFSIDPMVCILPKPLSNITLYDSKGLVVPWTDNWVLSDEQFYAPGLVYKNGFHKNVLEAFERGLIRGSTDDILNILISCQFLQDELDKIVKSSSDSDQNEGNDMVSFMRTVLTACNESMGSINDLDTFYDEKDDLFYVIDRKVTPPLRNFIPTISLTGIRSIVSKLSIESKIGSNIANMISVAAQGTGGHTKDNIAPLLEWNRGLLDRHIIHKAQKNDENGQQVEKRETPEDERLKKWTIAYYAFWEEFNGNSGFWADDGDYDKKAIANIKGYHKEFCQKWVVDKRSKDPNDPVPAPGVIPIELSFTMMGIGGLKIGQAFLVEEGLLPQQYSDNFGFIITGISHNIQDGKWTTDVKTQFYSTRKPTAEEIAYFKEKYGASTKPYKSTSTTGSSTGGGSSAPVVTEGQTVFTSPDLYIPPNGRVTYRSDISKQKRPVPVQKKLMDIMAQAAEECNVKVSITSAGNVPRPQRDTALFAGNGRNNVNSLGSVRHDNGFAADIKIYDSSGQLQNVSEAVTPVALQFFKAIRRLGVHCIGTGNNYMGGVTAHIDICAGNSKTGTIKTNFTAPEKGPVSSWLRQFMKDTRTALNAPSGTAGGQSFKCYD